MFEKHLRKSDILSEGAGRWQVQVDHSSTGVFTHFASKNHSPGFPLVKQWIEMGKGIWKYCVKF